MEIQEISDAEYHELWLDLPISTPNASSMDEAFQTLGCCVKSKEKGQGGMPAYFGRLQVHDKNADHVVVISYPKEKPIFKWEGTVSQYHSVWNCD